MSYPKALLTLLGGFAGVLCLVIPCRALAAEYYVDSNAASDGSGSMATPFKTLGKLQGQSLSAGDRVLFAKGSLFPGALDVTASGTANAPITLTSYGTGALPLFTNTSFAVSGGNSIVLHGSYIVVDGLAFADGAPAPEYGDVGSIGAVHITEGANHVVVQNNDFKNAPIAIRIGGEDALITRNHIHDCTRMLNGAVWGPIAVFVSNRGAEISYNRIENYAVVGPLSTFGADGGFLELDKQNTSDGSHAITDINIHHNVSIGNVGFIEVTSFDKDTKNIKIAYNLSDDLMQFSLFWEGDGVVLENNTIRRINAPAPPAEEIVFGFAALKNFTSRNNIFMVRDDLPVYGGNLPEGSVHTNNIYFAAGNADPVGFALDPSEHIADPMFVDVPSRNFHLKVGSPAIDAGATLGYTEDLLGRGVPFGLAPDIGALEFQGADGVTGPTGDPSGTGGLPGGTGGSGSGNGSGGGAATTGGAPNTTTGGTGGISGGLVGGSANASLGGATSAGGAKGNPPVSNGSLGGSTGSLPGATTGGTASSPRGNVQDAGCGCRTSGSPGGKSSGLFVLLGLALTIVLRRRDRTAP